MSARRQARAAARATVTEGAGIVPRVLRLGRCIEVWEAPGGGALSAWRRFGDTRSAWLDAAGIEGTVPRQELISHGGPWSADPASAALAGHCARTGDSAEAIIAARFTRIGCTVHDIPELRAEAAALYKQAIETKYRRHEK